MCAFTCIGNGNARPATPECFRMFSWLYDNNALLIPTRPLHIIPILSHDAKWSDAYVTAFSYCVTSLSVSKNTGTSTMSYSTGGSRIKTNAAFQILSMVTVYLRRVEMSVLPVEDYSVQWKLFKMAITQTPTSIYSALPVRTNLLMCTWTCISNNAITLSLTAP